jgi:hypothetical protein
MSSHETKFERSENTFGAVGGAAPKCIRRPRSGAEPRGRDLPIHHPDGPGRYLGRPPYFGPFQHDAIDELFECKLELELAEEQGRLTKALALLGLSSKEQWWHIEASFYQRHLTADPDPEERHRQLSEQARRQRRQARSAEGTPAPVFEIPREAPVSFEVYCELSGARAAWSDRGLDPIREAVRYFLLEAADLFEADLYWTDRLAHDRELARLFARKKAEYRDHYANC